MVFPAGMVFPAVMGSRAVMGSGGDAVSAGVVVLGKDMKPPGVADRSQAMTTPCGAT
jgi:hypothetical protein